MCSFERDLRCTRIVQECREGWLLPAQRSVTNKKKRHTSRRIRYSAFLPGKYHSKRTMGSQKVSATDGGSVSELPTIRSECTESSVYSHAMPKIAEDCRP